MRIVRAALLASTLMLFVAACGPKAPAPSAVTVSIKEWAIEPAAMRVAAGKVTFTVANAGTIDHDFAIEGAGKIDLITPGDTKTLEITLEPGTYDLLCDLAGHKEAGMVGKLTVAP
ncbi:MAG: cupredoxin domain-containing protein [Chloroflexota bacterium]